MKKEKTKKVITKQLIKRTSGVLAAKVSADSPKVLVQEKEVPIINLDEAKRLYSLGLTDEEVAFAFNVSPVTIYRTKSRYPELQEAYKQGTAAANLRVEQSLFKRANGFEYEEITKEPVFVYDLEGRKILKKPELKVVRVVKKVVPPDVGAISMWLRNKKAEDWKDLKPVIIQNNQNNLIVHENKIKAEEVDESHIGATRSSFASLRKFGILDAEVQSAS